MIQKNTTRMLFLQYVQEGINCPKDNRGYYEIGSYPSAISTALPNWKMTEGYN